MILLAYLLLFQFDSSAQTAKTLDLPALRQEVPEDSLPVFEPQESLKKNYRGFPVMPLLKKLFGEQIYKSDTVVFHCEDGYRADIPLLEFKMKKALLAFAMVDSSAFSLKTSKESIPLGPFYLVWDHPDASSAKKEVYRWPYAVTKVDLINKKNAYSRLEVKDKKHEVGHQAFIKNCFSCHSLNDVGGQRGPALNAFFQSQDSAFLVKYILDPKSLNPSSQMSGLPKDMPGRGALAKKIVAYGKKAARVQ